MSAEIAAIFCLAYLLGLLLTGISGTIAGIPTGAIVLLMLGVAIAFSIRRIWRMAPAPGVWLAAGVIGMAAVLYFHMRLPQPSPTDLCHWVAAAPGNQTTVCQPLPAANAAIKNFQVEGQVVSSPRLTRSDRLQFELEASQLSRSAASNVSPKNISPKDISPKDVSPTQVAFQPQPVTGKVYVTLPKAAGEQLYPGLTVTIEGSLYRPKPAANPGGFNFEQYLAQQGIFTGLNGTSLQYPATHKPDPPPFWSIRQRIVQVQERGLGNPEAALVSAMVMGKGAVDVPYPIQDQFKQTGLAHALAASGAQVSLLLGVILSLTQRFSNKLRFGFGSAVLLLYLGLTGVEPSVFRAGVMGFVSLFALLADRKVKPVGALLFAATVLLLYHPSWIWDLGFQLSFLATLGLLVTLPAISRHLDWMPSTIAVMFAVPLAATVWTLPILLGGFGILSPYSLVVNVLVSPLITIVSIGGMISAVLTFIHPLLGSLSASLLYYPAHWFIQIAQIGSQLPGSSFAVGTIRAYQILLLYGIILLIWRWQRLHRFWLVGLLLGIGLIAGPASYHAAHLTQVTVLVTSARPVLVIQDRGSVGLVHSGEVKDIEFAVLPFLQKQGVNHLDWAIAPSVNLTEIAAWQKLLSAKPIDRFYSSPDSGSAPAGSIPISASTEPSQSLSSTYADLLQQVKRQQGMALPLSIAHRLRFNAVNAEYQLTKPDVLQLQVADQTWLWLDGVPSLNRQADLAQRLGSVDAIGWSGKALSPKLLEKVQPKIAIVFGQAIDPVTEQWLKQHQVQIHPIDQAGALQWRSQSGFVSMESF